MKDILTNGSTWPLEDLDKNSRAIDIEEALEKGNHGGASKNPELLRKLVEKDVTYGYSLPVPLQKVSKMPGAILAPMNIQTQNTIDEHGKIIEKDRLTHDQSFEWKHGGSVNMRVIKERLLPCMFGKCLSRLINWVIAARRKFPGVPIVSSKNRLQVGVQEVSSKLGHSHSDYFPTP